MNIRASGMKLSRHHGILKFKLVCTRYVTYAEKSVGLSVILIVGPKCTLAASRAAPWCITLSMRVRFIKVRKTGQTDGRTPDRYVIRSAWRGQRRNTYFSNYEIGTVLVPSSYRSYATGRTRHKPTTISPTTVLRRSVIGRGHLGAMQRSEPIDVKITTAKTNRFMSHSDAARCFSFKCDAPYLWVNPLRFSSCVADDREACTPGLM